MPAWLNQMTTDIEPADIDAVIRSFDRRLRKLRSKHLLLRGKHWRTIRYHKHLLRENYQMLQIYKRAYGSMTDYAIHQVDKLDAIDKVLIDACQTYNDGFCQNDCDCDPNGWEGCWTRLILNIINESSDSNIKMKTEVDKN